MLSLKALMHKISFRKQVVMLIVLILFSITQSIFDNGTFNTVASSVLPKVLIGLAIIYLQSEKKALGAHLVLLLTLFSDYIYQFMSELFSFHFGSLRFLRTFDIFNFLGLILSIYLIVFVISLALNEKKIDLKIAFSPLVVFLTIYLYARFGFQYAALALALMVLFMVLKSKVPLYLFMLSYVINIPFFLIDLVIDRLGFYFLSYWIYALFGLVLLIVIAVNLLKSLNEVET